MSAVRIDFKVANNADWERDFGIHLGANAPAPWAANVRPWTPATEYTSNLPASFVVESGDLFMANAAVAPSTWISSPTFAVDAARWIMIGAAASYAFVPYDLTGAKLAMQLAKTVSDSAAGASLVFSLSTDDGRLVITDPLLGGVRLRVPAADARALAAGLYAYDLIATHASGAVVRLIHGTIEVERGITA